MASIHTVYARERDVLGQTRVFHISGDFRKLAWIFPSKQQDMKNYHLRIRAAIQYGEPVYITKNVKDVRHALERITAYY